MKKKKSFNEEEIKKWEDRKYVKEKKRMKK